MAFGMGLKICSSDGVQLMLTVGRMHLHFAFETILVGKLPLENVYTSFNARLGSARRHESAAK